MSAPDRSDVWRRLHASFTEHGVEASLEEALGPLTTYQVGGAARVAVRVRRAREASLVAEVLAGEQDVDVLVVGRGSNLLVADEGFDGVAVLLGGAGAPESMEIRGDLVDVSGWMALPVLARRSVAAGRCGLEWAVGVPGSVGGGVRMNAGGHGADVATSLVAADVVSLRSGLRREVAAGDLGLHFRGSALAAHHIVLAATFRTTEGDGSATLAEIVAWRREHQPGGRNAGSVFVNPAPGEGSAGAIIDGLGLRGLSSGRARVSEKHANFIQADDGATAADVVAVMRAVRDTVESRAGVALRSEIRLVGFDAAVAATFADGVHEDPARAAEREALAATMGDR